MSQAATKKKKRLGREELTLNLMILPGLIILIIFVFAPLVGSLMAFENYVPAKGLLKSKWVGLSNFEFIFSLPDSKQVFMNTLIIAFSKLVVNIFPLYQSTGSQYLSASKYFCSSYICNFIK